MGDTPPNHFAESVWVRAGRVPLVAFDDLQWSDESSNQLLRYVASNLTAVPVLVVGTHRTEDVAGNAALRRTLDELDRRQIRLCRGRQPVRARRRVLQRGLHDARSLRLLRGRSPLPA